MTVYDTIGTTYTATRRPDPRIGAHITAALGDARTVLNVGAGTGAYEPPAPPAPPASAGSVQAVQAEFAEFAVFAVEPSQVMIGQRSAGSAPVVRARAEALPVADNSVDAVMALLTVHHWTDLEAGIAELRRVARHRVVVLTWDQSVTRTFWLVKDYLPQAAALDDTRAVPPARIADLLGGARVEPVLVPHDCTDGFGAAFWRRPEAYLDPLVRAGMSMLSQVGDDVLRPGLDRLAADLTAGTWHDRYNDLLDLDEFDGGYRLVIADL
ncbi:methyltransferase domain-containing protein [Dactylosporangium sp. NPDC005555]|uniref:class I SAM-dependent methyltransferase n=1 Tax=Dactylosporangium sp. NPDC005555 TaxID=3154889 RepID=UPI0033BA6BEA